MNRRTFFSHLASLVGLVAISSWGGRALADRKRGGTTGAAAAGDVKMVDPKSSTAKAVNYVENKAEIKDASLKADRQGMTFDKQNCKNCSFYSNPKTHGGGEVGNCQIFPGQNVKSEGWCSSWNKKA